MIKFANRGLIYCALSCLGLGYELFFVHPPRVFLVIMYAVALAFSLLYTIKVREYEDHAS